MRQPEIHHGTSPATVPGASKRKKTDPRIAELRRNPSELNASKPYPVPPPLSHHIWPPARRSNIQPA
jgi:hypothetical protein